MILLLFLAGPPTLLGMDRQGDPLPPGAAMRLGTARWQVSRDADGQEGLRVALSPDGKAIVAAGRFGFAAWRRGDGRRLPDPPRPWLVRTFHFLPGGEKILLVRSRPGSGLELECCSWPGLVVESRPKLKVIGFARDAGDAFSHGGRLWPLGWWGGLSDDGKLFAACGRDGSVRVHDAATGRAVRALRPGDDPRFTAEEHRGAIFAPDNSALHARTNDGKIVRWCLRTGKSAEARDGNWWTALSPDGKTVATLGKRFLRLYDGASLRLLEKLPLEAEARPWALAYSPCGKMLLVGQGHGVRLLDAATAKDIDAPPGHRGGVIRLLFSPDGRLLASGGGDGLAIVWETATGKPLRTFRTDAGGVASLAFSPDGRTLAVGDGEDMLDTGRDGIVRLWDVPTGESRLRIAANLHHVSGAVFLDEGRKLATKGWEQGHSVWDVAAGKQLEKTRTTPKELDGRMSVSGAGWGTSRDGALTATRTGARPGPNLVLIDNPTKRPFAELSGPGGWRESKAVSPDGRWVAQGGVAERSILLWDVETLRLRDIMARLCGERTTDPDVALRRLAEERKAAAAARKLLPLLDADSFGEREDASGRLAALLPLAAPALAEALAGKTSLEMRVRIQRLLDGLKPERKGLADPRRLSTIRADLRRLGTPDALRLLRALEGGL